MNEQMTTSRARDVLASDALVCDVDIPAAVLGISKAAYYDAVKRGDAPVMPIMVGRRQRYRVADVRALLGIDSAGPLGAA